MKKIILCYALFAWLWPSAVLGCDMCAGYFGMTSGYQQNFIGYRYNLRGFEGYAIHSHNMGGNSMPMPMYTEERFITHEIWGRYFPVKKLQLSASIPYSENSFAYKGIKETLNGFDDPVLLAQYRIMERTPDSLHKNGVTLFGGGGIELPLGVYKKPDNLGILNPHLQPGSGSLDFLIVANCILRHNKTGINAETTFKANTPNQYGFRYANRFSGTTHAFYSASRGRLNLIPYAGGYFETAGQNQSEGLSDKNSGGYLILASVGLETAIKKFAININYKLPVYNGLNGIQAANKQRLITSINYLF